MRAACALLTAACAPPAALAAGGSCAWKTEEGTQYMTWAILKEGDVPDADTCCASCSAAEDCGAFSFQASDFRCTLMRNTTGSAKAVGVTSATRPPPPPPPPPAPPGVELRVCPDGCPYTLPSQAAVVASDRDTIVIEGTTKGGAQAQYEDCMILPARAASVTVRGEKGRPLLHSKACYHKAAIITAGTSTRVENIEVAHVTIDPSLGGNGAAIRHEGKDLYVSGCYFHDGDEGILTGTGIGGRAVLYNTTFENLGGCGNGRSSCAHGTYINDMTEVIVSHCTYKSMAGQGHHFKSRAYSSLVQCTEFQGLDGVESRLVDIPDGGNFTLLMNVIEKGPKAAMGKFTGYAEESDKRGLIAATIKDNIFVRDQERHSTTFIDLSKVPKEINVVNNIFVTDNLAGTVLSEAGASMPTPDGNTVVKDRATAKLPAYPTPPPLPDACKNVPPPSLR